MTSATFTVPQDDTYNGWYNYETWNVALWMGNDEIMYRHARANRNLGYRGWAKRWQDEFGEFETPDGVAFMDRNIDADELDAMLEDDF